MGTLNLGTLGTLRLSCSEGGDLSRILSQPKRFALLVYLALAEPRGYHRRDSLLTLFWPESDDDHARNALSQALSFLRRELPDGLIQSRGMEEVGLDHHRIYTGVEALEEAVAARRWADALDLYTGEFLKGFHLSGAFDFEAWMEVERERLRELAAGAAWSLAGEQIERGSLVEAERTAQRALKLVWTDETPVREFMKALAGAGDRAAALNLYEKFCSRLKEELDLDPSPSTAGVADAIKNGESPSGTTGVAAAIRNGDMGTAEMDPEVRGGSSHWFSSLQGQEDQEDRPPLEEATVPGGVTTPVAVPGVRTALSKRSSPIPQGRRLAAWGIIGVIVVALLVAVSLGSRREGEAGISPARSRQLTFSGNVELASLSPDGKDLAYLEGSSPRKIIVQDLGSGAELTIAGGIGKAFELRWSPDGSWVGFSGEVQGRFGLYFFPRLGGAPRVAQRYGPHFALSPDGERLASWYRAMWVFLIQDLESGQVDSIILPERDGLQLTGGDWSPREDRLAVVAGSHGGPSQIILLDLADGTEHLLVTDSLQISSPRWSGSGDALFFLRDGYRKAGEIWRVEVDPVRPRLLQPPELAAELQGATSWTNSLGSLHGLTFDISEDGHRLAYRQAYAHTNISLFLPHDADGSEPTQLSRGTAQRRCPRLSPDGSSVAFLQESDAGWDLFRVSVTGGAPVRLTFGGAVVSDCASWGPDSRRLAIGVQVAGTHRVATVPGSGGALRIYDHTEMSLELAWAPASLVAYQTPGNHGFQVLDPDTGSEAPLIPGPSETGWMFDPRFSPDGTELAVYWNRSNASEGSGVWVVSLEDGSEKQLSARREFPIGWSGDGMSLYAVDPGGVVRRYSREGGEPAIIPQPPGAGDVLCQPHERSTGIFWICRSEHSFTDVWMVEGDFPGR